MINNWEQLEEFAKDLISDDNPKLPANSGGTKGEEDVIGSNIIIQCKYTDNKNMSILKKDLDRLLESANLLSKFPIFLTSNGSNDTVISIPINKKTKDIIKQLCSIVITMSEIEYIEDNIKVCKTRGQLEAIGVRAQKLESKIKFNRADGLAKVHELLDVIERKYVDIITCNLFGDK
jgi:hypothetical protein